MHDVDLMDDMNLMESYGRHGDVGHGAIDQTTLIGRHRSDDTDRTTLIRRILRERPVERHRRRRRNRPGNAQAEGPQGDDALESGRVAERRAGSPTE